jgi:Tol biopolymer transport system component
MKHLLSHLACPSHLVLIVLAVLALGGCAYCPAPMEDTDSPDPRLLYLHDLALGQWQVFALQPGFGEPSQLTDAEHGVFDFALSVDGTAIVCSALREDGGADLWAVGVDGTNQRRLLACPGARCTAPTCSPDGRIAYERHETMGDTAGVPRIWLLDPDGGGTEPLFASETRTGFAPRWSPDPRRLRLAYVDETESAVRVYDVGDKSSTLIPTLSDLPAVWGPTGERLVVIDARLSDVGLLSQFWLADVDKGTLVNISGGDRAPVEDMWPAWSPSGEWIAFTRRMLAGDDATMGQQLWLMRSDGSDAHPLVVDATATFSRVAWRPDGGALAYVRRSLTNPNARPELWLLELPDGEPVLLAEASTAPVWVPRVAQ